MSLLTLLWEPAALFSAAASALSLLALRPPGKSILPALLAGLCAVLTVLAALAGGAPYDRVLFYLLPPCLILLLGLRGGGGT